MIEWVVRTNGIGSGVAVLRRVSEGGAPDPQRAGFTGSVALHLRHRLAGWPRESFLRSTDLRGGACGSEPRIAGLRAGRVPKCGGRTLFPGRRNGGCCGRGKGVCRTDESQLAEQLAPLSGRRRLCRRRFFRSGGFDDPIDESGGECLLRREPAAGAVVFGHQEGELLRSAARTGGIDLRQACVGFAEQVDAGRKLFGIAFGGADRIVDQVEGVGRYFAASLRCGLCDDCGRRSRIAVAAGDDVSVERREGLVDQQGVVYVAARRADIDDDFRGVDFAQPVEAVPEFFRRWLRATRVGRTATPRGRRSPLRCPRSRCRCGW